MVAHNLPSTRGSWPPSTGDEALLDRYISVNESDGLIAVAAQRASAAGLVVGSSVTKKTSLVVAADPDSLSGKARKAGSYGTPVVAEGAFATLLDQMK
jgi:hypothetical protein